MTDSRNNKLEELIMDNFNFKIKEGDCIADIEKLRKDDYNTIRLLFIRGPKVHDYFLITRSDMEKLTHRHFVQDILRCRIFPPDE